MAATLLYVTSLPLADVIFAPHQSKKLIPVQSRTITTVVFWLGPPALWIWNEAITMRLACWNLREQTSQKWKICSSLLTHTLLENSVFGCKTFLEFDGLQHLLNNWRGGKMSQSHDPEIPNWLETSSQLLLTSLNLTSECGWGDDNHPYFKFHFSCECV